MCAIFKSAEIGIRQTEQSVHRHECAELYVSLGGRTTDVVNGREAKTLPFDVFVLTSDVKHGQINTEEYRYCIFKFDRDALIAALGDAALGRGFQSLFVIDPSLRGEGESVANMCVDAHIAQYAGMSAEILSSLGECDLSDSIFLSLARLISECARRREVGIKDAVAEAVFYMNTHYSEPITVSLLASACGYSARHLSRLFARYCGMSPMQYLANLRLSRAAELLSENRLTLTEISERVGICDSSAFSRNFRQRYGITPTEYRRRSVGL